MKVKPNEYLKKLTCLYVEDDENIRESFLIILNKIFKEVFVAKNGKEGLELFKKHSPDIILSDIKMPIMDGLEMSKEIKALDPDAYIILLTAFTDIEFLKKAIDLGVEGYITKPVDKKKLYHKLNFLAEIIKHKKEAEENLQLLNKIFEEQNDAVILAKHNDIKLKNSTFINEFGDFKTLDDLEEYLNIDLIFDEKPSIVNIEIGDSIKTYEISYKKADENHKIITFKNISEINKKIYTDELTKAFNRKYLSSISNKLLNKNLCFIILDIDNFKQINDTKGHLIGDIVLQILSEVIRDNLRKDDYFIRWGGEEFLIIPNNVEDSETAAKIAEHLRQAIEKTNFMEVDKVTCSFGVSCNSVKTKDDIKNLFKKADKALYKAKETGKNKVEVLK
ncbi:ggdef domain protein [Nautilia profundicola AmH]|uniref:diguanylate cyclase n=1 Tax=Nautilia profundicola (strain ATCC BAA-1463 / DSM 18972 / AmH) TaxID=598659 RepID=B9L9Z0_NAUPA|nr:diguanylate cyclase [Nautilia profundicola]ACM92872.1 ggdef domain protein [Nautilia profundicola AmH]